jgi:hypothetical protein
MLNQIQKCLTTMSIALLISVSLWAMPSLLPSSISIAWAQSQVSPELQAEAQNALSQIFPSHPIDLNRVTVVEPYAMAYWRSDVGGGEAIIYRENTTWRALYVGGGALNLNGMVNQGIPRDTARQILQLHNPEILQVFPE